MNSHNLTPQEQAVLDMLLSKQNGFYPPSAPNVKKAKKAKKKAVKFNWTAIKYTGLFLVFVLSILLLVTAFQSLKDDYNKSVVTVKIKSKKK